MPSLGWAISSPVLRLSISVGGRPKAVMITQGAALFQMAGIADEIVAAQVLRPCNVGRPDSSLGPGPGLASTFHSSRGAGRSSLKTWAGAVRRGMPLVQVTYQDRREVVIQLAQDQA